MVNRQHVASLYAYKLLKTQDMRCFSWQYFRIAEEVLSVFRQQEVEYNPLQTLFK